MIGQQTPLKVPVGAEGWWVPAVCLALAAITFAVFGQAAGFGFVNFDDNTYVYENAKVAGGLSLKGLAWVFSHADCSLYHPLTMLSLMADHQLYGLHAGGFHFTNVVLHTASVVLLFLILRQMTGALWRSAFVAAVFAIHPLRVESVAWVSERKDVIGALFFMITVGAYVRYVRKPQSLIRYLTVAVVFVLALLSKPTVVTLPFVLLLLDYWPLQRTESARRLVMEKIPLLALAAGACAMTVVAAKTAIASHERIAIPLRLGNALVSYAIYLRQMIWPEGLAVFYPQPENGYPVLAIVLSFFLLALISGGVWACRRKQPWLLAGWLWYLGMLTPMIGILQAGIFAHADRMTYLPQIGIYMALTWLVAEWRMNRVAMGGIMATVLGVLIFCTWKQTTYWRDSETLWTRALDCTTRNGLAHINLGIALEQKGDIDEASTQFEEALQIKPDDAAAHNSLGYALREKGRVDEAIAQYQKALQIRPDYTMAHYNLGFALRQAGRVDEAIAQYQEALKINPDYPEAHFNLGNALAQNGKLDDAIAHYQKALQIKPDYADAEFNLGNLLMQKGKDNDAVAHFQRALEINPNNAGIHHNLGLCFYRQGRMNEAISQYRMALQIAPADLGVLNNLAWLLATCADASLRDGNEAVELARQANELSGGEMPVILGTLAAAYAEAGRLPEAVETAQRALRLAGAQSNIVLAGQLQSELKYYQAGQPFHGPAQTH